jgi:hypothetical protein
MPARLLLPFGARRCACTKQGANGPAPSQLGLRFLSPSQMPGVRRAMLRLLPTELFLQIRNQ